MFHKPLLTALLSGLFILNCGAFFECPVSVEGEGEAVLLELDGGVYRHSGELSRSVRLLNAERKAVPFLLVRTEEKVPDAVLYQLCETRITGFEQHKNGSALFRFELKKEEKLPLGQIELKTPEKDFHKKFRLYAIENGKRRLLLENSFFDHSSKVELAKKKFTFPPVRAQYFELEFDNYLERSEIAVREVVSGDRNYVTQKEKLRELWIKSIVLYTVRPQLAVKTKHCEVQWEAAAVAEKRITEIIFSAGKAPLESITLAVKEENFSRNYELRNDKLALIHRGKLRRIATEKIDAVKIPLHGDRSESYTLTIFDQDNPPLEITGVNAQCEVWGLLFFRSANPAVCLFGDAGERPQFDIGEVLHYSPEAHYAAARLGDAKEYPGQPEKSELGAWVFRSAIALTLLVVAWILFRSFRKIETLGNE